MAMSPKDTSNLNLFGALAHLGADMDAVSGGFALTYVWLKQLKQLKQFIFPQDWMVSDIFRLSSPDQPGKQHTFLFDPQEGPEIHRISGPRLGRAAGRHLGRGQRGGRRQGRKARVPRWETLEKWWRNDGKRWDS